MSFRLSLTHSVPEQHVHIVEPVAKQVLQYILEKLGYLEFFRENGNIDLVSDFNGTSKAVDKNGNPEIHHNRVRAKLNYNLNPSANKWQGSGTTIDLGNGNHLITNNPGNVTQRQAFNRVSYTEGNASVMSDVDAFTDLVEYSVGSTLTMEVQLDFKDDAFAFECLTRVFQCFQNGEMIGYVDVQYDYPVPTLLQSVYKHVSDLMGDDDYADRMIKQSGGNITIVQNRNNPDKRELVVKKNHFQALFQLECTQEAPTPGDPDGAYINMTITVQFARANRLMLKYPIIVNNQFVDFNYVPVDKELRASNGLGSPVMWRNLAVTQLWEKMYPNRVRSVHYPWWDDWDLPPSSVQAQRGFKAIATIAFCLDLTEVDKKDEHGEPTGEKEVVGETIIDLIHGLPGIKLNDDIIQEIMSRPGRELLLPNRYVNIAVFADDYQLGTPTQIEDNIKPVIELVNGKLIVRAVRPYTQFRLVISINPKPMNLTAKPVECEVYPSRWYDVTAPLYINSKDSIVNDDKRYFYFDTLEGEYIEIPTTPGEPFADVYQRLAKVEEVYELSEGQYVVTQDTVIAQGKQYYTYKVNPECYIPRQFTVGVNIGKIKETLAEAGCIYEYKDAIYGDDIVGSNDPYVGYTICHDTSVKYDTKYYFINDNQEMEEIENVEFGDELPVGVPIYIKEPDTKKYYINKTEVNMTLGRRMQSLALSMTADDVTLPVYEEVEIPAGTPLQEVLETLGVHHLYTDNPNAAPSEPTENLTNTNHSYLESYKGYNALRTFLVTFYMKKKHPW